MFRNTRFTQHRYARLFLAAALLLSYVPARGQSGAHAAADAPKSYVAKPNAIQLGRTRTVVIMAEDRSDFAEGTTVDTQSLDAGIEISGDPKAIKNRLPVVVTATDMAALGLTNLTIIDKDKNVIGTVELNVSPITGRPTPGGMSKVDAMWSILPEDVVKHNFGSKVAKNFYGIEVVIGNNSGFDLQLATVGFRGTFGSQTRVPGKDGNGNPVLLAKTYDVPTSDQKIVRGTIERERTYGKRAMATNFVSSFGPFFGGFLPFFHAANAKANFGALSSLLNGQFKEGVSLFAPDLTVAQLGRLENQAMHEDMIIPNNSQRRTVTFLPKGMFRTADGKLPKNIPATELMDMLGEMVIVGREFVAFEHREIVVEQTAERDKTESTPQPFSTPSPLTPTLSPNVTQLTPDSGLANEMRRVTITGTSFTKDTTVTFDGVSVPVLFDSPTQLTVTAPERGAGTARISVSTPGTPSASGKEFRYFERLRANGVSRAEGPLAGGTEVRIFGAGFLPGLKVMFGDTEANASDVKVSDDGTIITVKTPSRDTEGAVTITITNPDSYPGDRTARLADGYTYVPNP